MWRSDTAGLDEVVLHPGGALAHGNILQGSEIKFNLQASGYGTVRLRMFGGDPESVSDRVEDVGRGVASRPVVNLSEGTLIVQTSDARLNVMPLATRPPLIRVRSWRETFQTQFTSETDTQPQTP